MEIPIRAGDGGYFTGYLAPPSRGRAAGLLVIQEIFGANRVMRDLCDGFAARGFLALCPDLFWRQQPGIQLSDRTDAEWQQAFQLYQGFDEAKGVEDLLGAMRVLRSHPGASGKVGAAGYGLGGKLAYLAATRTDIDCAVGYYGVAIDQALAEAPQIRRPLMLHIAEDDSFVPTAAQQQIAAGLSGNPLVALHSYPGMEHAFARPGGPHYDRAAADLANARTTAFLSQHLS